MAKIWCERCKGSGKFVYTPSDSQYKEVMDCRHCHGYGHTDQEVVGVSEVESTLSRLCTSYRLDEDEIWEHIWGWVYSLKEVKTHE